MCCCLNVLLFECIVLYPTGVGVCFVYETYLYMLQACNIFYEEECLTVIFRGGEEQQDVFFML